MSCLKLFSPNDLPEGESASPRLRVVCFDDTAEDEPPSLLPFPLSGRQTVCVLRMTPPCPVCNEVSLAFGEDSDAMVRVHDGYPRLWQPEPTGEEFPLEGETDMRTCHCRRCEHVWQVADGLADGESATAEGGRFAVVRQDALRLANP